VSGGICLYFPVIVLTSAIVFYLPCNVAHPPRGAASPFTSGLLLCA
jgi:hypothetical protein